MVGDAGSRPAWPTRLSAVVLVPALLAAAVLIQTRAFRRSTSETVDEPIYLRLGLCIYRQGSFDCLCSPKVPALPLLLEYWLPAFRAGLLPGDPGYLEAVPGLVRQARLLTSITLGVPLAWAIYAWLASRRGWVVGALGGALVAFSPSLIAASSLATTDACFALFAVLALAAMHRHQVRPSPGSFAIAGAAMGLALAAKQTGAILLPVALAEAIVVAYRRRPAPDRVGAWLRVLVEAGARVAGLAAIMIVAAWACYGFTLAPPLGGGGYTPIPTVLYGLATLLPNGDAFVDFLRSVRPPLAIDTLMGQLGQVADGRPAFLMGRHSQHGWWYFFPVALALKSTPAELLMFALTAVAAARPRSWADPARRLWLESLLVLLAAGISSALNIGHRYMLLAYPLAILIAVDAIGEVLAGRPRRVAIVVGSLAAWQALSALGIAPHYLSYFNSLCGGPSQGYRYLVDSSLDWGQDLPSLRRALEARGYRRVALLYFGGATPEVHGLRTVDVRGRQNPSDQGCDWVAISATELQGAYTGSSEVLEHFGTLPSIRVGYSIFLYDLKDPRVRRALDAVRGESDRGRG